MSLSTIISHARTLPKTGEFYSVTQLLNIADDIAGEVLEFDNEEQMNKFVANLSIALS